MWVVGEGEAQVGRLASLLLPSLARFAGSVYFGLRKRVRGNIETRAVKLVGYGAGHLQRRSLVS